MDINVLSYLERSAGRVPEKIALLDEVRQLSYREVLDKSKRIGTALSQRTGARRGIGVYMEKEAQTLCAFFGAVYAGCFYCALNTELPASRLGQLSPLMNIPEL